MKFQRWALAAACVSAVWCGSAAADVKLPKIFGDHMVLQQKTDAAVWGWADPEEEVTVTFGDAKATTKAAADGKWHTTIKTADASKEPRDLVVKGKNEIKLTDVLVGEVWICSGQSNMEWSVNASANPQEEVKNGNHPLIRQLKVAHNPAEKPVEDINGQWLICSPETVGNFTAVGYFFARDLQKELDVPVGLINTSWGGTLCEAWTSKEALETHEDFKPILERSKEFKAGNPNQAAVLYNGMVAPIIPFSIRGAIWYQGESNAGRGVQYGKLFPTMIADWRKRFGQGDFPFLFVQIAPWPYGNADERLLPELWEAQLKTLSVPNTGMAVIHDIGDIKDIHPKNKQDVGKRLALWALAKTYNKSDVVYSGPLYKSMQVDGDKVVLNFDHVGGGLVAKRDKLTHFEIAGEDQKFVPAEAKIEGKTIVVSSPDVQKPASVRFAWKKLAEPNLFNEEGLPASPFRTDEWPLLSKDAK